MFIRGSVDNKPHCPERASPNLAFQPVLVDGVARGTKHHTGIQCFFDHTGRVVGDSELLAGRAEAR